MKYAVIEDELFTRERLINTVRRLRPEFNLIYEGTNVEETIKFLQTDPELDLVFMDVELSDGNCFQILDEVTPEIPIIFTTAFDSYALKAFQTYGIGYIMKPYADEEIEAALRKFENLKKHDESDRQSLKAIYETIIGETRRQTKRILTVRGDCFEYMNVSEIIAFEMKDGLVFLYRKDGKSRLTNFQNLQSVMNVLPKDEFFQVGRGLILNINIITKVSKYFRGRLMVHYDICGEDHDTMVSSNRRQSFLEWLGNS